MKCEKICADACTDLSCKKVEQGWHAAWSSVVRGCPSNRITSHPPSPLLDFQRLETVRVMKTPDSVADAGFPLGWCANSSDVDQFSSKLHENEENWAIGGAHPWRLLGSATVFLLTLHFGLFLVFWKIGCVWKKLFLFLKLLVCTCISFKVK